MQKLSLILFSAAYFLLSCEKKYERPDVYTKDLFADRNDTLTRQITHEEALQRSAALIVSKNIKIVEQSADSATAPVFMYLLEDGKVLANNDSIITIPLMFLSPRKIPEKSDSLYLYLEKVRSHKILAGQNNIRYQLVANAPTTKHK